MNQYTMKIRVGAVLPKDPYKLTSVKCNNTVIKDEIESLSRILFNNLENKIWTEEDYQTFRSSLIQMDLKAFKSTYPEILNLVLMPKESLEERLKMLTNILDISIFADERITVEVPKKTIIDGEEKIIISKEYNIVPHQFKVGDLITFLDRLYGYIHRNSGSLLERYQSRVDECETIEEKITELSILYDSLNNNDCQLVDIVRQTYQKWYQELPEDDSIRNYLNRMFPEALEKNKSDFRNKIVSYKKERTISYERHVNSTKEKLLQFRQYKKKKGI